MTREVIFSLKPEFAALIESREKNHEFRGYLPKITPRKIWFYITKPVSSLVYIAEVGSAVVYPQKIGIAGVGNSDFNAGRKMSKYAFPIMHLCVLKRPLPLVELQEKFGFTAPQGFVYANKYPKLYNVVYGEENTLIGIF